MHSLQTGDLIASFSPSFPITARQPARYRRAVEFLAAQGMRFLPGQLTGRDDHYRSASPRERAEELNALLRNREVRCILSTIGGSNSNAMLPYLDYEAFRRDPKIVVGYSDATAILLALYAKTGVPTFYGPALVASLGEFPPVVEETWRYFAAIAMDSPDYPLVLPTPTHWTDERLPWESQDRAKVLRPNQWRCMQPGQAEGRLIGGNLNTLYGFLASPYFPALRQGDILLLEDGLKDAATVEKNFAMLKLAGAFDLAGAVLLGKHEGFDDCGTGRSPADILLEILDGQPLPILADFDCCHTHPMLTLPLGVRARVDAAALRVELLEDWRALV
ncbi:S66 family peptidase [Chromobacterium alticapitis]|uniref:LD-carboxypeptidase n=1 Tax=Chromobacterium alticapitis TaxID=2073169 RepID=A0A2S5DLK1_9NEIS|nr:S66 peptidase family protein [Chromobacterium alticapitis]POZ63945.1 LD-carboxypeptidase [Chromobacterium alticapitis]